jgi:hypothetical protein
LRCFGTKIVNAQYGVESAKEVAAGKFFTTVIDPILFLYKKPILLAGSNRQMVYADGFNSAWQPLVSAIRRRSNLRQWRTLKEMSSSGTC